MPFDWYPIFRILGEGKIREADTEFAKHYNELVSGHADEMDIREECLLYIMKRNRALNRKSSKPIPEDEMSLEPLVDKGVAYKDAAAILDRVQVYELPARK
ncbi:MAG: hypothetical protein V1887_02380 [Candidatus Aenigmatarchaeota archaeon]